MSWMWLILNAPLFVFGGIILLICSLISNYANIRGLLFYLFLLRHSALTFWGCLYLYQPQMSQIRAFPIFAPPNRRTMHLSYSYHWINFMCAFLFPLVIPTAHRAIGSRICLRIYLRPIYLYSVRLVPKRCLRHLLITILVWWLFIIRFFWLKSLTFI